MALFALCNSRIKSLALQSQFGLLTQRRAHTRRAIALAAVNDAHDGAPAVARGWRDCMSPGLILPGALVLTVRATLANS